MSVVWHVLCNISGDKCLLDGVKFPTAFSGGHKLAPCRWDPADILKKAPWLEAVRTEIFVITLFMLWNITDLSKPLDRAIKEFDIILLESQKRNLKIKFPRCSWDRALHVALWFDITRNSRGGCASRRSGGSAFWTCAWLTLMILFVLSNGAGGKKALQWAWEAPLGFNLLPLISLTSTD